MATSKQQPRASQPPKHDAQPMGYPTTCPPVTKAATALLRQPRLCHPATEATKPSPKNQICSTQTGTQNRCIPIFTSFSNPRPAISPPIFPRFME
ncbi:MAG: hypothetical protein EAY75_12560 [Bacteroidetes bacterium]|nr:MAG: hypothetical protein EAY75_12560 [Bacteroidota bacterium]